MSVYQRLTCNKMLLALDLVKRKISVINHQLDKALSEASGALRRAIALVAHVLHCLDEAKKTILNNAVEEVASNVPEGTPPLELSRLR